MLWTLRDLLARKAKALLKTRRGPVGRSAVRRPALGVESLEGRDLPAIHLVGGILTITASPDGADNNVTIRDFNFGTQVDGIRNGVALDRGHYTGVTKVIYKGSENNDRVTNLTANVILEADGAGGDDTLTGGGATDRLVGGSGNDTLVGGAGADILIGGVGNDWLYNGDALGNADGSVDRLTGEAGADTFYTPGISDTITDLAPASGDRVLPLPAVSVRDFSATEGDANTTILVPVTLSSASRTVVTVSYATVAGSATAGSDYVHATGTVRFNPGQTRATIPITIVGDRIWEGTEAFQVVLTAPAGAVLGQTNGTVTVADNEPTPVTISAGDVRVSEAYEGSTARVAVTLSTPSTVPVTVKYATAPGSATAPGDFVPASGTLTFAPGEGVKYVNVAIADDFTSEAEEAFQVVLSAPSVGATLARAAGTVTVADDDFVRAVRIDAGAGNDQIVVRNGSGADVYEVVVNNTVRYASLWSLTPQLTGAGLGGDDTLNVTATGYAGRTAVTLLGGDGNDTLYGGSGADELRGEAGNDRVVGNAGDDALYGDAGDDRLEGGDGADRFDGGVGNDAAYGGAGNDVMAGGYGRDTLRGEGGDDLIYGSQDNDTLDGGDGADTLFGDDGDDWASGGLGNDVAYGGDGADRLDGDNGDDQLHGYAGNDVLAGGAGNDLLSGGLGNDTASGGLGDDGLYGSEGNDTLDGSEGDDWASGGDGNDTLYGGFGSDALHGEAGDDLAYGSQDNDFISGGDGVDTLFGDEGDDAIAGGTGNDVLYGGDGADRLDGDDGDDQLHGYAGDDTIWGGAGNDLLSGGLGNDTAHGGLGNDALYGSEGSDALDGNEGDDMILGGDGSDNLVGGDGWDFYEDFQWGIDLGDLDYASFLNGRRK